VTQNSQTPQAARAVVVGVENFLGLQTARILAGHGVPVIGIATDPQRPFCRTNACEKILYSDTSTNAFVQTLLDLGPTLDQKAVLFPCGDISVWVIAEHHKELAAWYHILQPEPDVVDLLMNKSRLYPFAQEAGLPISQTFILKTREEAVAASEKLNYPSILKPGETTPDWLQKSGGIKVYRINSAEELLAIYDRCAAWVPSLIVQEWVEGPESSLFSCNCYFDADSNPLVTFVARKIRQFPPETGVSSLSVEERNDVVLQTTIQLFKSVHYRGLGYLEMKRDTRTGENLIIEPNIGRPTGRSAICEAGGVELIYTAYCDAAGLPLPENRVQQYIGAKWIYWQRDLKSAFHYWRRGELTLKDWLQSLRGKKRCAVFSWSDPAPFWFDLAATTRKKFYSLFRKSALTK